MIKIIEDGNFSGWLRTLLCIVGAVVVYCGVRYERSILIMTLGLAIAAVGGFASRAKMLKIKPFDNSYKKARDSYRVKDDEENKP
ncbi:hypothetical protein QS306_17140 [Paraburkholderia bonniea]|uniref:hypothetical protein n=1 Tax=Paraburkholderia bonniea TaxID=2152891 RepID=UPI002574028B|nr:hypothetical protein [Paraburkholderia bonniea]WJF91793.1 hypothetical protein QS306_17140 [Paraburkholderia bonniea]WJF95113.1 hypothetical protein QS308_17145 [Paraburkholderia bonniea]